MVKFYVAKIEDEEINVNTGVPWKVEDVPKHWRSRVEAELKKESEENEANGQV